MGQDLTFLIDTGADISLCKKLTISSDRIDDKEKCKLNGITKESVESSGTTELTLRIGEKFDRNRFHIVGDNFPIKTDGIIGRDILEKYICRIDFETYTITFSTKYDEVTIPMNTKPLTSSYVNIAARAEVIIPIDLVREEDSLILSKEIRRGVFVGNTIIPAKGVCHVKILNTNDRPVKLKHFDAEIKPLKDYRILEATSQGPDRLQRLLDGIKTDVKDKKARDSLMKVIAEYQDVFHLEGEKLTVNNFYKQKIATTDDVPVYTKNYKLPHAQLNEIEEQVKQLSDSNIIEPSVSPYNSPLLIVPKKGTDDKKHWRLVVDYRRLNNKIVSDKFPLTRLEDVLDKIGRAKYFSTLDMTSSFHQIELEKSSRPLTAFSTGTGHFQFKRLPFGLKISSNSFQRMLTIALTGLGSEAFLYVDDIIVFGCSINHHNENLIKVLQRLRKYNLKLNASKCQFLKSEVVYLGHLITDKGIRTDPTKNETIRNYPIPKNADEVRRFVAFCNYYRRFIPDFAGIAKELNALLKKNATFTWTGACQTAFNTLKQKLIQPPILQYPDFDRPFILTTDASNYALGAVLSQGEIGNDLPISYASKSLGKHDLNKPVIEKELLAIHWGINFFRPYLYGRKFIVVTDHRPLVSLFSHKNPSSKLTRIRLDLSDYDFDIVFKQGKMNTNADALSRIELNSDILKKMTPVENDTTVKKTLAITRGMSAKRKLDNIVKNVHEDAKADHPKKPDQLHIWDCSSISDVRDILKLKFILNESSKNKIMRTTEGISVYCSNKTNKKSVSISDKLHSTTLSTDTKSVNNSDNSDMMYASIMKKLLITAVKWKIHKLALSNTDDIFQVLGKNELKSIINTLQQEKNFEVNIMIYEPPKRIEDIAIQKNLIKEYHDTPHGGHLGVRKTILKLKQRYCWKNMSKMVKDYISNCKSCRINKQTRHTKERMVKTDTPSTSFETISIDTVGPLRISNGYRYVLTMQCELTKFVVAAPIQFKDAKTVAETLVKEFILKYGIFKILKSDQGTEFTNKLMKEICELLKINQKFSTPYHHETLGTNERNHRVLNEYILAFAEDMAWDIWIPYYTFAYNTTPHVDNNYTPYELVFGKLPYLPDDILHINSKVYNIDDYAKELKIRLQYSLDKARKIIEMTKIKRINDNNKTSPINVNIGDLVLLRNEERKKNQSPYLGPYKVKSVDNVNLNIEINGVEKTVHKNRVKKF